MFFGLKMVQFFMFLFVIFFEFLFFSLRLKLLKVDDDLFQERNSCYGHLVSFLFWCYKHKPTK